MLDFAERPPAPRFDDKALTDPYPFYAAVRAHEGLCWSRELGGWLVAGYHDIRTGLADPRFSAARLDELLSLQFPDDRQSHAAVAALSRRSMFFMDPPRQTEARLCIGSALRRQGDGTLTDAMAGHAQRLAGALAARGQADLLIEYALPLSIALMGEMVHIDALGRSSLRSAVESMVELFGGGGARSDPQSTICNLRRLEGFVKSFAQNPALPGGVLGRALAVARERGLDHDQLTGIALDLIAGGYVPLTNLIGNTLWCLLQAPDQLAAVRRSPELITRAVQEAGRFEAPNQITSRIATEDLDFVGTRIAKGDLTFFLLASGNRDPEFCSEPDRFDLERRPVRAVTFGSGSHTCIGISIGVQTAEAALRELLNATCDLKLAGTPKWSARTLRVRGLINLPARCS